MSQVSQSRNTTKILSALSHCVPSRKSSQRKGSENERKQPPLGLFFDWPMRNVAFLTGDFD